MNRIHDATGGSGELAGVDLNLVVAFDALARERSVTRAAQRLGVTQSAMSHALRRLRELLGDPLMVRGRGGMVLTPRAEYLAVPLRSGLVTIHRALARPEPFDPRTARRRFTLASPDLFDVHMLPPLLARVRHEAPGIDLAVVAGDEARLAERLETGDLDVALVPRLHARATTRVEAPAPGLVRRTLFHDRFVCLLRADHPALRSRRGATTSAPSLTLETYAALSHALVSRGDEGPAMVDRALERHGLTRRIALRVPNFYSALAIVGRSDLVLTAPTALARLASADAAIVALPPPLPLPGHCVDLVWHERFSEDRGHCWLRGLLTEVTLAELGGDPQAPTRGRRRGA
jgi:DNA-binding transcriptional LysR family regulator